MSKEKYDLLPVYIRNFCRSKIYYVNRFSSFPHKLQIKNSNLQQSGKSIMVYFSISMQAN